MFGVSSTFADLRRRDVLVGGAVMALLAACGPPPPPAPDPLEEQLRSAVDDAALATAATAAGVSVPALTTIAAQRSAHAQALAAEIDRAAGRAAATTSTSPPTTVGSAPPAAVSDVVQALRTSAEGAATLAAGSSGYRAGLLGSIAAACTAAHSVALAGS